MMVTKTARTYYGKKRPNYANAQDACCRCGKLLPTPSDHEIPAEGELGVWQPSPLDPPQWICSSCQTQLESDARKNA